MFTPWSCVLPLVALTLTLVYVDPEQEMPESGCELYPLSVGVSVGTCVGRASVHACRGRCESSAFPSPHSVLHTSGHNITSVSQCCTIRRLHKVQLLLDCGDRLEQLDVFSAAACRCDMCRQSRY